MNVEPNVRIRCLPRGLVVLAGVLSLISIAGPRSACADPVSELASFSIFDKVDLAQLAKSDVKTAHGPPMRNSRFLAVQSCYVAPGSPAQQMEALRRWNPARYGELKVYLHTDLPSNPTPANFEKLKNAPGNASVRSLVAATEKLGPSSKSARMRQRSFPRELEVEEAPFQRQSLRFGQMCSPRGRKLSHPVEWLQNRRTITAARRFGQARR